MRCRPCVVSLERFRKKNTAISLLHGSFGYLDVRLAFLVTARRLLLAVGPFLATVPWWDPNVAYLLISRTSVCDASRTTYVEVHRVVVEGV
jgi:hypothetical protein